MLNAFMSMLRSLTLTYSKSAKAPRNAFSGKRTKRRLPRGIVRERESAMPKLFTVSLQINNEYETVTIDTASTHSLLHIDLVVNALTDMIPITSHLQAATGDKFEIIGTVEADIGDHDYVCLLYTSDAADE